MDLSSLGLDEDTQSKVLELHESEVKGLKSKVSELLSKNSGHKLIQEELEAFKAESIKAAEEHENAKLALIEKDGTVEQYKNAMAEKDERINTLQREFQEKESARLIAEVTNDFSKQVCEDEASQLLMTSLFKDSLEVRDGEVRPKDVTMTNEQLVDTLVKDQKYSRYIKANVGSGSGSTGSANGSTGKAFKDMSLTEKSIMANTNPELYAQHTRAN